jgi:hypothetical protein
MTDYTSTFDAVMEHITDGICGAYVVSEMTVRRYAEPILERFLYGVPNLELISMNEIFQLVDQTFNSLQADGKIIA